ncbi:hypothetical protein J8J14_18190 [Roseomonas sp. SSH11]|uniref:Uncharacterized protein n=1 Tax=Pararoseomonas baculiformis TaxID=2820812 RepID=A0ABS4AJP0_9PROT|nr:hypothetical protein [Pararoseomonas baculiformis]MBP0446710.1 hypothetical protein [Pararoseomonas baculiformis]
MTLVSSLLSLPPCSALARLSVERSAVSEAILALSRRRDALLLSDLSDRIIHEIDAETDRLHLTLERLDAVECEVLRREHTS